MFGNYNIVDENGQKLSSNNIQLFNEFIRTFDGSSRILVFRGENRINELYNCNDITEMLHRVFMIGAKGEHFWKQCSKYITKTICKTTFKTLFDNFQKIIERSDIISERTKKHLCIFKESNKEFCEYFLNSENSKSFCDSMMNLSERKRRYVMDYYIAILHNMGHVALNGSHMISTTTDFSVAKHYQNSGVIFVSWVNSKKDLTLNYNLNKCSDCVKEKGLPICNVCMFPEDQEICIAYGLLPHKIIGVINDKSFFVNPNMFRTERTVEDNLEEGFYIDQSSFGEVLKLTKYKRAFDASLCLYSIENTRLNQILLQE